MVEILIFFFFFLQIDRISIFVSDCQLLFITLESLKISDQVGSGWVRSGSGSRKRLIYRNIGIPEISKI